MPCGLSGRKGATRRRGSTARPRASSEVAFGHR